MHFPVFLSSIHNEPLGKLGVVFRSTQTRFILPYEASLTGTSRNPNIRIRRLSMFNTENGIAPAR